MMPAFASRRRWAAAHGFLVALLYGPILAAHPGVVGADTKTYLYLDPARLLSRAPSMWDPNVGMGTLTHQTIGYLFPMGPWYWVFERVGAPDWVAQRLWLATVMFAAASGVLFLWRTLAASEFASRGSAGALVAACAYGLSPYVLDYSARISVILLPWAALPWLIALAERALRRGGWRHPGLFALIVLGVGGVNATALVFAGLGPVLWFPFAIWVTRHATVRQALTTVARIGVLTTAVSLWWVAGLAVQGRFGIPILKYTETVETVARTSLASEILRGLGYWFFYGNDVLGPWIEPASDYTQRVWLIAVGFAVPVVALAGAAVVRWRHRAYCICLIVVGVVIAVGAHPYDNPSPLGSAFKALATTSTVGLALRSTPRAVPLVALGSALLLGAFVTAAAARAPRLAVLGAIASCVLVIVGMPPLFTGDLAIGENIKRPEEIPSYWSEAGRFLDSDGGATRVLEIPGTDFSSYRWGNTIDPITPYLMDRPYVARELIPYGSPQSADLLNAFDRRLQEGIFEPTSLVPIARLMNAGAIAVRNDLQFERYRTPRPQVLWQQLAAPFPTGITGAKGFGPPAPRLPASARGGVDEIALGSSSASPTSSSEPRSVEVLSVAQTQPIVYAQRASSGMIVAGDGEGLVDLAAAGILDGRPVRYAASLRTADEWNLALRDRPSLVLTDSNRLRGRRWGTVRENTGFTEQPGAGSLVEDPSDARLEVFPNQMLPSRTVAQQRGVKSIRATHYGNPVSFTPEDRAANALDGDLTTAWRVGAFADVRGERLRLDLEAPARVDRIRVVQPLTGPRNRFITRARLRLDGRTARDVELGDASRTQAGQVVSFTSRTVRTVELEILDTNVGKKPRYDGISGVGIAELDVAGVRVDEVVRLPTELLSRAGEHARDADLSIVVSRQRSNPADPNRADEEPTLKRQLSLPHARSFTLRGTARLSAFTPDEVVDKITGGSGVIVRSDSRLPGDLGSRASSAFDGDSTTAWQPGLLDQVGHWIEAEVPSPVTFDHLELVVRDDGSHSVPSRIRIDTDGVAARFVDIALPASSGRDTLAIPLSFEPVTAKVVRITVEDVRSVTTRDFFSGAELELPVAIAEVGIPGVRLQAAGAALPPTCRDDLLRIDDTPVPVRLTGDSASAAARDAIAIEPCTDRPLDLGAGDHELRAAPGFATSIDIDRLVLASPATSSGGNRASAGAGDAAGLSLPTRVTDSTRTSFDVEIDVPANSDDFWIVLGQSHNKGWHATVAGDDLGPPVLINGFANGWRVHPNLSAGRIRVHLEWTPQRWVNRALVASALATMVCLAIVAWTSPRRRRDRPTHVLGALTPEYRGERAQNGQGGGEEGDLVLAAPGQPRVWGALLVTVAFGLAAGPLVGVVAGLVTLVAALLKPARWLLAFGSAVFLACAGAYVARQQSVYGYPPDFSWPVNTQRAHTLGWLAVALLAGSALTARRLKND